MDRPRLIWDSTNNSTWATKIDFDEFAISFKMIETNFEEAIQGADGAYDLYTCGLDNLPGKKRWNLELELYKPKYDVLETLWLVIHDEEYSSGVDRVNTFFKFIPDIEIVGNIYNCQFIGQWNWQYTTYNYNDNTERRNVKLNIWEI